ncbi:hypothetical protein [Paenibacillus sp. D2_2]|uniref:hypothetical protein n=1 Tax=Paenibacillus sp. D2_2 TaxID=3073092 RepID=UPI0035C1B406
MPYLYSRLMSHRYGGCGALIPFSALGPRTNPHAGLVHRRRRPKRPAAWGYRDAGRQAASRHRQALPLVQGAVLALDWP